MTVMFCSQFFWHMSMKTGNVKRQRATGRCPIVKKVTKSTVDTTRLREAGQSVKGLYDQMSIFGYLSLRTPHTHPDSI